MHAAIRAEDHDAARMMGVQGIVRAVAVIAAGPADFGPHVNRIADRGDVAAPGSRPGKGAASLRRARGSAAANPAAPFAAAANIDGRAGCVSSPGGAFTDDDLVAGAVGDFRDPHAAVGDEGPVGAGKALTARDTAPVPQGITEIGGAVGRAGDAVVRGGGKFLAA